MKFDLQISTLLTDDEPISASKDIFFQTASFLNHQGFDSLYTFSALDSDTSSLLIQIKFISIDHELVSLPRCPFGGFKFYETIREHDLRDFINYIKTKAASLEIGKLVIKQPAAFLGVKHIDVLRDTLSNSLAFSDINQHIDISEFDPEESLHKMQRRRVLRCLDRNFTFKHEKTEKASELHAFIATCRESQGILINIDEQHFIETIEKFPYHYDLFTVRDSDRIIAATVTVKVNEQIVYNYLPASDRAYGRYSPMVFLIAKLIAHYDFKKYKVFDMGVSSIEGKEQENLRGFKNRIGGIETAKDVFEIELT